MRYSLNLKDPQSFNEKIQWLKLFVFPYDELVIQCADKATCRLYLKEKGLSNYINDVYYLGESLNRRIWRLFPSQFVLKVSNGCGYNLVITDKSRTNYLIAKRKINKWVSDDFGKYNAEPHYSMMQPTIICEKYLGDNLIDYKIYCFNGVVVLISVIDHSEDGKRIMLYNRDGSRASFVRDGDAIAFDEASLPDAIDEMISTSEFIAEDFCFVRVDWYCINNKLLISELTFTPNAGLAKFSPKEADFELGKKLDISDYK